MEQELTNECESKDIFRMRNTFDSKMNCVSTMIYRNYLYSLPIKLEIKYLTPLYLYVYTVISLLFLSANLIYIIVLTQFIFKSKVFLILKMSLLWHSFVNCCSISVLVFVVWETLLKMISAVSWK